MFSDKKSIAIAALKLLVRKDISAFITELVEQKDNRTERMAVKLQVVETLRSVMRETAKGEFIDV